MIHGDKHTVGDSKENT